MADVVTLREAVAELVHDGDTVALEGFTHLIPHAAGHELIRQGRRDLTLVRMTPDIDLRPADRHGLRAQAGLLVGRQPGRGLAAPLPRRGRARLAARRSRSRSTRTRAWRRPTRPAPPNLPFGVLRGYAGTDLPEHTASAAAIECPFTGERLAAVRALRPDVGVIHAQQADRDGNVQLWGISGVQKEAVLAARSSIVTVEEIVERARAAAGRRRAAELGGHRRVPRPRAARTPRYAHGYYERDNGFYRAWDAISRDRETFTEWMRRHVLETADVSEYHASLGASGGPARMSGYTAEEMMAVAAARRLRDGAICFVGIGLPEPGREPGPGDARAPTAC